MKILAAIYITIFLFPHLFAQDFIYAQLKYKGNWDPYPSVYLDILSILSLTTSVEPKNERRVIDVDSNTFEKDLSITPFVILLGSGDLNIADNKIEVLRNYIINGGTIYLEDISGLRYSQFDNSVRKIIKKMFPEYKIKKTDQTHVLLKSFYLIRKVNGRFKLYDYLEYVEYENRPAIIYSRNDIISCWARDKFGNFIYDNLEEGEQQRFNAQKLFLNVIMYTLCGTYKSDKVHEPFIEQKLKNKK